MIRKLFLMFIMAVVNIGIASAQLDWGDGNTTV